MNFGYGKEQAQLLCYILLEHLLESMVFQSGQNKRIDGGLTCSNCTC